MGSGQSSDHNSRAQFSCATRKVGLFVANSSQRDLTDEPLTTHYFAPMKPAKISK